MMQMPGGQVKVFLRTPVARTLLAMWRAGGSKGSFSSFLGELLEVAGADFRLRRSVPVPAPDVEADAPIRSRGITPEKIKRILAMRFSLTETEIGARVGLSQPSVHRVLAAAREREKKEAAD